MLRILYYLCTKSGKISAKKGGGLTSRHGRTLRILRYNHELQDGFVNFLINFVQYFCLSQYTNYIVAVYFVALCHDCLASLFQHSQLNSRTSIKKLFYATRFGHSTVGQWPSPVQICLSGCPRQLFAPLGELIKCCTAAAPSVFTMMTLLQCCAYLHKIIALGGETRSNNSSCYSGTIELCALL